MTTDDELSRLRGEARKLRKDIAGKTRSVLTRDHQIDSLTKEVKRLKKKLKERDAKITQLAEENNNLKTRLSAITDTAKKYAGMIFKSTVQHPPSGKKTGAQIGHKGHHRKQPDHLDEERRIFLTNCTIPGFQIGLNALTHILFLKYRLRTPRARIVEELRVTHRLTLTEGAIQHLLPTFKSQFTKESASLEMSTLHTELKTLFAELTIENEKPFIPAQRTAVPAAFLPRITAIIARTYTVLDACAVQTRITNQGKHLIEALLHEGASLTKNHAERMIRPMVVTRTISGGSRTDKGAATHAVNMSIMQTLSLKGIDFIEGVRAIIHAGSLRYVAGKG